MHTYQRQLQNHVPHELLSKAGVAGGSTVSRVTIEVDVVGSNPGKGSLFFLIDRPKVRKRGLANFDANRRTTKKAERCAC